jgi:hypothetical protein
MALTSTEHPSTVDFEEEAASRRVDETLLNDLDRPETDPVLSLGDRRSILRQKANASIFLRAMQSILADVPEGSIPQRHRRADVCLVRRATRARHRHRQ